METLKRYLLILAITWGLGWIELISLRQYLNRRFPEMRIGPEVWTDYVWPIHNAKKIREDADKMISEKYNTWLPPYLR